MTSAVWVPNIVYRLLPWLCIAMATVCVVVPVPDDVLALLCIVALYVYGATVLARRWYDGITYSRD